jgi:hypothetical protein
LARKFKSEFGIHPKRLFTGNEINVKICSFVWHGGFSRSHSESKQMALVHIAGKLKFRAERKGKKRKKAFLNNWTPWN